MLSAIVLVMVSAVLTKPVSSGSFPGTNGKIVFTSSRDGNNEIYVMDADGSNQTRLTSNSAGSHYPDWSQNVFPRLRSCEDTLSDQKSRLNSYEMGSEIMEGLFA